jgi:hypothetical protein
LNPFFADSGALKQIGQQKNNECPRFTGIFESGIEYSYA